MIAVASSSGRARSAGNADVFDLLIVGAGPVAAATLMGLKVPASICVVTGASGTNPKAQVHAKIRVVADHRGESVGLTDPLTIANKANPAFSTAVIGGLANYWGQQFVRYLPGDPWPRSLFCRYRDYEEACNRVEKAFTIDQSIAQTQPAHGHIADYRVARPRLLIGTADDPAAGLLSMRRAMERLVAERNAGTVAGRVESLRPDGPTWQAQMSDGSTVVARQIVLAAGVLGTARLLGRSFPDISAVRLRDHRPWMLYTHGLERLVETTRSDKEPHFNVQTIWRSSDSASALFAAVYNMRYAELNLCVATLTGQIIRLLYGLRTPWPIHRITPVQVWTDATLVTVETDRLQRCGQVVANSTTATDHELTRFIEALRDSRVSILSRRLTPALQGFHYFGLQILTTDGKCQSVQEFLAARCDGKVQCLDASGLPEICCRPPGETMMARALTLGSRLQQ